MFRPCSFCRDLKPLRGSAVSARPPKSSACRSRPSAMRCGFLEERVGQPLFLRVGRKVQLTDAGRVYQRSVRQALDDLDAAQQRLEPFRRASSVVIYAPRDFGRRWLLPKTWRSPRRLPGLPAMAGHVRGRGGFQLDGGEHRHCSCQRGAAGPVGNPACGGCALPARRARNLFLTAPLADAEIAALPLIHDEGFRAGRIISSKADWRDPVFPACWISATAMPRWRRRRRGMAWRWPVWRWRGGRLRMGGL